MMKYIPKLTDWRNELVTWLAIAATTITQASVYLSDVDLDSIGAWLGFIPAVLSLGQRQVAYGLQSVKRDFIEVASVES